MGHSIHIEGRENSLLSAQEVRDLIDLLYRGESGDFTIVWSEKNIEGRARNTRGLCQSLLGGGEHTISLSRRSITDGDALHCGGNVSNPCKGDARAAAALVLAHEICHANQSLLHPYTNKKFWGTGHDRYSRRGCEMEARAFVDDRLDEILATVGCSRRSELPAAASMDDQGGELAAIADVLGELQAVSREDMVEELRSSGLNNPVDVERLGELLRAKGVRVS